jgi:transposase-like protein/DNA-directed RNA polymerase subunit RPC12/RpoP
MRLIDVAREFGTPEACNDYLEKLRWPDGITCLHCESKRVSKFVRKGTTRTRLSKRTGAMEAKTSPDRIMYVCLDCKKQFSAGEGTIFSDTHLSLNQWFMAAALMINAKKGLSAKQIQRDLGCAYKTAWYLCHRIRKAMEDSQTEPMEGVVEADATFIGGKFDKRRKRAKYGKQAVFGIVQRKTDTTCSKVYAAPVLSEIKREVLPIINRRVSPTAKMYTDDGSAYRTLSKTRVHEIVVHTNGEYVRGDVHSNSVEGFWSLFKRGLIGQYHQLSVKHLSRYLNEFQFRFNNRDCEDLFTLVILRLLIGNALRYKALIECLDQPTAKNPHFDFEAKDQADDDDVPF